KDKTAVLGPLQWNGRIALGLQEEEGQSLRQWQIKTEGRMRYEDSTGKNYGQKCTATDGDIIVMSDNFEHDTKTDVLTVTGNVRYFSTKANLTCEKAVIYRKEKRAVLTGAVKMLIKPRSKQTKAVVEEIPPFRPIVPEEI